MANFQRTFLTLLFSDVKTRLLAGLTATEIHDELTTTYGHDHVPEWVHRFSSGRESLDDDPRSDHPLSVISQQNIVAVQDLVTDDPHINISSAIFLSSQT